MAVTMQRKYLNTYESMYDTLSKKALYDERDWTSAANENDLAIYTDLLSKSDQIKDVEKFKKEAGWDYVDSQTRRMYLWLELGADKTNKDTLRTEKVYNSDGTPKLDIDGKEVTESYKASDYEYLRRKLNTQRDYFYQQYKLEAEKERKADMNFFQKLGADIASTAGHFLQGFGEAISGFTSIVDAVATSVTDDFITMLEEGTVFEKDAWKELGENFTERIAKSPAKDLLGEDYAQTMLQDLAEFEAKYSHYRDVYGNEKKFGQYINGLSTMYGQMFFAMAGGQLGGAVTAAAGGSAQATSTMSTIASKFFFYAPVTARDLRESYTEFANDPGYTKSTNYILANAVLKSGMQIAIEEALGSIIGTSNLDAMVFGKGTTARVGSSLTTSALKRIGIDALEEGMEEVFQDTSDVIIDYIFGKAIAQQFGANAKLDTQSLMDSFILGALGSIVGNAFQITSELFKQAGKDAQTYITYDKDGNMIVKKLNALAAWEYGLDMQSLVRSYNQIVDMGKDITKAFKPDSDQGKAYRAAFTEMYAAFRMLSSIYTSFGEERSKAANDILTNVTNYINQGEFDYSRVRADAMFKQIEAWEKQNANLKFAIKLREADTEKLEKAGIQDLDKVITRDDDLNTVIDDPETRKAIDEAFKADSNLDHIYLVKQGNTAVALDIADRKALFVPVEMARNESGEIIYQSVAEQYLVEAIATNPTLSLKVNEIQRLYKEISGFDCDAEEAIYQMVYNTTFYQSALYIGGKKVLDFAANIAAIANNLKTTTLADAIYKKTIDNVLSNMTNCIKEYCINQTEAVIPAFVDSKVAKEIKMKRYSHDLYNRVINGETLTESDWYVLNNRVAGMSLSQVEKKKILDNLKSDKENLRRSAMNRISNVYALMFKGAYDGMTYLEYGSKGNNAFNYFLQNKGLTLKNYLSIAALSNAEKAYIADTYGDITETTIKYYREDQFSQDTQKTYDFEIENGNLVIRETKTSNVVGFNFYKEGEGYKYNTTGKTIVTGTTIGDLSKILSDKLDDVAKQGLTIDDAITNPTTLLTEEICNAIRKDYGVIDETSTFMYLRRQYVADSQGKLTIVRLADGTYAFGSVAPMDAIYLKGKSIPKKSKSPKISDFVQAKYLTGRLADIKIEYTNNDSIYAQYKPQTNTIVINNRVRDDTLRFAFAHEFQHAIQYENSMSVGMQDNWLFALNGVKNNKQRVQALVDDIKKHRPDMFKRNGKEVSNSEALKIANNYVYYASGEYQAYGMEGAVNFEPVIVKSDAKGTTVTLPWGSVINLSDMPWALTEKGSAFDIKLSDEEKLRYREDASVIQKVVEDLVYTSAIEVNDQKYHRDYLTKLYAFCNNDLIVKYLDPTSSMSKYNLLSLLSSLEDLDIVTNMYKACGIFNEVITDCLFYDNPSMLASFENTILIKNICKYFGIKSISDLSGTQIYTLQNIWTNNTLTDMILDRMDDLSVINKLSLFDAKNDKTLRDKYGVFKSGEFRKGKQDINHIEELFNKYNTQNHLVPLAKEVFNKLKLRNTEYFFDRASLMYSGVYHPGSNKIVFNLANTQNYSRGQIADVLLHESIHATADLTKHAYLTYKSIMNTGKSSKYLTQTDFHIDPNVKGGMRVVAKSVNLQALYNMFENNEGHMQKVVDTYMQLYAYTVQNYYGYIKRKYALDANEEIDFINSENKQIDGTSVPSPKVQSNLVPIPQKLKTLNLSFASASEFSTGLTFIDPETWTNMSTKGENFRQNTNKLPLSSTLKNQLKLLYDKDYNNVYDALYDLTLDMTKALNSGIFEIFNFMPLLESFNHDDRAMAEHLTDVDNNGKSMSYSSFISNGGIFQAENENDILESDVDKIKANSEYWSNDLFGTDEDDDFDITELLEDDDGEFTLDALGNKLHEEPAGSATNLGETDTYDFSDTDLNVSSLSPEERTDKELKDIEDTKKNIDVTIDNLANTLKTSGQTETGVFVNTNTALSSRQFTGGTQELSMSNLKNNYNKSRGYDLFLHTHPDRTSAMLSLNDIFADYSSIDDVRYIGVVTKNGDYEIFDRKALTDEQMQKLKDKHFKDGHYVDDSYDRFVDREYPLELINEARKDLDDTIKQAIVNYNIPESSVNLLNSRIDTYLNNLKQSPTHQELIDSIYDIVNKTLSDVYVDGKRIGNQYKVIANKITDHFSDYGEYNKKLDEYSAEEFKNELREIGVRPEDVFLTLDRVITNTKYLKKIQKRASAKQRRQERRAKILEARAKRQAENAAWQWEGMSPLEGSRYVSRKKATGTNLENWFKDKKYVRLEMPSELQYFIVKANDKIAPELWERIQNGNLKQQHVLDYLRTADDMNKETFNLINESFFQNKNIKSFKQLKKLVAAQGMFYAVRATMRAAGYDEQMLNTTDITVYDKLMEIIKHNKTLTKIYAKVASNYDTYKGGPLVISDAYSRMSWMRYFDGSPEMAGYIASIAKIVSISMMTDKWKVTGESTSQRTVDLDKNVGKEEDTALGEIIADENSMKAFDYIFNNISRTEKIDFIMKIYTPALAKKMMKQGASSTAVGRKLVDIREKLSNMSDVAFDKQYAKEIGSLSEEQRNALLAEATLLEIAGADPTRLTDQQRHKLEETGIKLTKVIRPDSAIRTNIKHLATTIRRNLSTYDKKRFLEKNSNIFDSDLKVKAELLAATVKTKDLKDLEDTVRELSRDVKKGGYNSKANMEVQERYQKLLAKKDRELKKALKSNMPKVVTVKVTDEQIDIRTDKPVPNSLLHILETDFTTVRKSTVKYLEYDNEEYMAVNFNAFVEANAEYIQSLSQTDVDELVDFFSTSEIIPSTNNQRKVTATQVYLMAFLLKGNKIGQFTLSPEQYSTLNNRLYQIVSGSAQVGAAWRSVLPMLAPEKEIINSLGKKAEVAFNQADIDALQKAVHSGNVEEMKNAATMLYTNAKVIGDRSKLDALLQFERAAMLSGPGTWVRNIVSNVAVTGTNIVGEEVGAKTVEIFNKLLPNAKWAQHRDNQYKIVGTVVTSEYKNFIKNNIIDNGLLDLIDEGLTKQSFDKDNFAQSHNILIDSIKTSIKNKLFNNTMSDNETLNAIYQFINRRLSDSKFVNKAFVRYLGKILVEDNVDITKGLTNDVQKHITDAYVLAAEDYMHKGNFWGDVERQINKKLGPTAFFMYKQVFPFAQSSFNWFMEGLNNSPVGLVMGLKNLIKLENTIAKMDEASTQGRRVVSSKFAEYLARRQIGKGIVGSFAYVVGALLVGCGVVKLRDDDDEVKLQVGNISVNVSGIFGTQGLVLGMTTAQAFGNKDPWTALRLTLDQMFKDSTINSLANNLRYGVGNYIESIPFSMANMYFPNFISTVSKVVRTYKPAYASGVEGKLQRFISDNIPFVSYAMPKYVDPYTGKTQFAFKSPLLTIGANAINKLTPLSVETFSYSKYEKEAINLGINKGMLTGEYKVCNKSVSLNGKEKAAASKYYGELNARDLNKLMNTNAKYSVTDKKGKQVELSYSQMTNEQKKTVINRIMSANATYAKIYALTESGKAVYYGTQDKLTELRQVGIRNNLRIQSGNKKGLVIN